jgi:HSP20 family protein
MTDLARLASAGRNDSCELVITAKLPGVDENDVDISVSGDTLTIKAEQKIEHEDKDDKGGYAKEEVASFSRSVRLPFEVDDEEISATLDDGVLTVRVQKVPQVRTTQRRLEVKRLRRDRAQD